MTALEVAPGIRRLLAPNPGMMTGPGTNTYLLGTREVAVVDPGPDIATHLAAIEAAAGAPIVAVWLTHAHPDHARAVGALVARTGARLAAWPVPNPSYPIEDLPRPDLPLADGAALVVDDQAWVAVHAPGHASDHVCFLRPDDGVLLTGDVVVGLGTVVIAPPDGDLTAYLASLERLRELGPERILPGHGDPIADAEGKLHAYIAHRLAREQQVLAGLAAGQDTVEDLVAGIYTHVEPRVLPVAAQQVLGHLEKLEREGRARLVDGRWRPA